VDREPGLFAVTSSKDELAALTSELRALNIEPLLDKLQRGETLVRVPAADAARVRKLLAADGTFEAADGTFTTAGEPPAGHAALRNLARDPEIELDDGDVEIDRSTHDDAGGDAPFVPRR
jgi:hypothetical protein